ncbi:redoxin domain-containing protein [Tellurirhabdus bombi]|uniref:redoxin domain-containing protein n=1 Tax=Tellurirhabdus bombi TaxID=2907205 RepID=UPI001F459C64|nr:redoxin domain-containing protein [Tellurirhabdus bombi]
MLSFIDTTIEDSDLYIIPQTFRKIVPIAPLKHRDKAPAFSLNRKQGIWQHLPAETTYLQSIQVKDLLQNSPLVVSFFSPGWNAYADRYLNHLKNLHVRIQQAGGNLLVLTTDSVDVLADFARKQSLSFSVAQDIDQAIAERFGVYSTSEPVWDRIAGITEDVPFPALFVLTPDQRIAFSYVDKDFVGEFPAETIVQAVAENAAPAEVIGYNRSAA